MPADVVVPETRHCTSDEIRAEAMKRRRQSVMEEGFRFSYLVISGSVQLSLLVVQPLPEVGSEHAVASGSFSTQWVPPSDADVDGACHHLHEAVQNLTATLSS